MGPSRRIIARFAWAVVYCVALLRAGAAHGATVAILSAGSTPAQSEVTSRLRGELSAWRHRVLLLGRPTAAELGALDRRAWLERTAEARGIDAAIEVIGESTPQAVDVWIFQRSPRRTQVARVVLEPDTPDRAGTLAIRAIEVLRSHSLEADLTAKARARDDESNSPEAATEPADTLPPPPAAAARDVARTEERAGVELGAGILTGLDGVGPAVLPVLRFGWRAQRLLLVQATVSGFGTRPTLGAAAGSVRVAQGYAALGFCYCPVASAGLGPYLALSAGAMRTSLAGSAVSPASAHALAQWSLLVDAGAGARWRLPDRYYATLSGHLQLAQPRVAIHVLDEQLASTGRPNLAVNLLLGAWL